MNAADYENLLEKVKTNGFEHPDIVAIMNKMTNEEMDIYMVFELGCSEADGVRRIVDLWCQLWDKLKGDGYFPGPDNEEGLDSRETHVFQKRHDSWVQLTGTNIDGLDGSCGERLLTLLNEANTHNCSRIVNSERNVLFTKV